MTHEESERSWPGGQEGRETTGGGAVGGGKGDGAVDVQAIGRMGCIKLDE